MDSQEGPQVMIDRCARLLSSPSAFVAQLLRDVYTCKAKKVYAKGLELGVKPMRREPLSPPPSTREMHV